MRKITKQIVKKYLQKYSSETYFLLDTEYDNKSDKKY